MGAIVEGDILKVGGEMSEERQREIEEKIKEFMTNLNLK